MMLDYQIINTLHPHYVEGRGCVYDDLGWFVCVRNKKLCDEILNEFGIEIRPGFIKNDVTEEDANKIHDYLSNQIDLIGVYGCEYDRNIIEIYNDK